ncbi:ThiF family adenylyltransferase [Albibacterium sp.]|uniref:ThiF family adenylyltransferase n=1 Tax=Albibacterium sp. TaxID=2952885 RepID=UPI002C67D57B|nr:ThiF family adenylyltransferase [Albibacterium sp.]HLT42743.1 ThiF family adenylyltransferase [Sphingobacteriaceae bacterium]HUH18452.1 ThiF family adenylyltransferase [Albibacterium sp.]
MTNNLNSNYKPLFYRLNDSNDYEAFQELLRSNNNIIQYDTIYSQLTELIKLSNPGKRLNKDEMDDLVKDHIKSQDLSKYGVWVYYPWSNNLVHLLDKEEFIKVRTNRNMYKITPEEIELLKGKKIGIIGLSVGQSIALTLAMERTIGALHLADFDDIELSNMNRLRVGVQDLGMSKVIIAARQIAELDPFIEVTCFTEGLTINNIDKFFRDNGAIDILVEECDGLEIKVLSRIMAKKHQIPVVMDTNDRGMLDVERFDLEPSRPIFHGRTKELENLTPEELIAKFADLAVEQKISFLAQIIGIENVSTKMKQSLANMNKTIVGWPQLASAVTLGGAMVTDTCRRILLNHFKDSGRYFVDFDELVVASNNKVNQPS